MKARSLLTLACVLCLACVARAQEVDYNRDVRPILADKCYHCHGPDEMNRKGKLRLDTAQGAAAVLKGAKPEATELYHRITTDDPAERMPPMKANFVKQLSAQDVAVLKRWLTAGAKFAKHWAFEPPVQTPLPVAADPAWQGPIDRLLHARLTKAGLAPAPRADKATLLRRVTLDLTGLPPTLAELDAFLQDASPTAYEKAVDRLLQSPRYGERMALAWLDLARYGDSSVYHADGNRDMWGWRDWVIRAFNDNMPFDRFTVEQLAGDLLPGATQAQKIASGFNRNHATTDEGGAIAEEFRVDYVVDRVKTVANTWLALSMECGQCHDHKYDPLSQREYYQFYAYFNNTKDGGMQTRSGNAAPLVPAPDPEAALKRAQAIAVREAAMRELLSHRAAMRGGKAFADWLAAQKPAPVAGTLRVEPSFFLPLSEGDKTTLVSSAQEHYFQATGSVSAAKRPQGNGLRFDGKDTITGARPNELDASKPFSLAVWVQLPAKGGGPVLECLEGARGFEIAIENQRPLLRVQLAAENALVVTTKGELKVGAWQHLVLRSDGSGKAAGVQIHIDGVLQEKQIVKDNLQGKPEPAATLHIGGTPAGKKLQGALDDLCWYPAALSAEEVKLSAVDPIARVLAVPQRTPVQEALLHDHWLRTVDAAHGKLLKTYAQRLDEERKAGDGKSSVMVMEDLPAAQMRPTFILNRGQYNQPLKDKQVQPGVPAVLPPLPTGAPANRLGLAQWLVQPEHPLTARVTVNRLWQIVFGDGLVRTSEDFGLQGEMPSNPELLDWLAVDFVRSGWDVKRMLKQLVTSAAYCQDSRLTPQVREADPLNRLLARGPRVRLQGELIRDGALMVSGLLVEKLGGPSVKPYQPPSIWEDVTISSDRYVIDKGAKLYRRTMYTYWKRSAPHPSLMIFDAPTREKCVGARPRTNTPLQALVALNDPQFVEAARVFGQRIAREGGATTPSRLQFAMRSALGRSASEQEIGLLTRLLEMQLQRFQADPKKAEALLKIGDSPRDPALPAVEHAAWTIVASTLFNLDEFLTKN